MYFLDVTNSNNERERVYVDKDIYLAEYEPTRYEKDDILRDIVKEVQRRNEERGLTKARKIKKSTNEVIITRSATRIKKGKRTPIFNERKASDYTLYNDGTHDFNEVRSQNYNDDYFDFSELKRLV
jgi:hypothetical protein